MLFLFIGPPDRICDLRERVSTDLLNNVQSTTFVDHSDTSLYGLCLIEQRQIADGRYLYDAVYEPAN